MINDAYLHPTQSLARTGNPMSIQISSSVSTTNLNQSFSAPKLSDEQKETINTILSDFDSTALSEQDAKDIVSAFQEAGIHPSKDFADTLETAGFDARDIGELAGMAPPQRGEGGGPPPPAQDNDSAGVNQGNLQLLQSILEQYTDLSNLSAEDEQALSTSLLDAGLLEPGALIDTQS